jgi:hypothetical protein
MAKCRNAEFSDFCRTGERKTNGALVMRGDVVFSYNMKIAEVCRERKAIQFFGKTVSRTTTNHQNSILRAFLLDLTHSGWTIEKTY